jgi:hypothetical protein
MISEAVGRETYFRPKAEGRLDNDNDKKFLVQHCMMHTLGLTAPTGNLKHVNPGRIGTA